MEFKVKSQLINEFLEKLYARTLRETAKITEWETLRKQLQLEHGRLVNYVMAVKDEVKDEFIDTRDFIELSNQRKQHLLDLLDRIQLEIPTFNFSREECMDLVENDQDRVNSTHPNVGQARYSLLNVGTPLGMVAGVGAGLIVTKSLPIILIAGVSGAIVGSIIGKASLTPAINRSKARAAVEQRPRPNEWLVNSQKLELMIIKRKKHIISLFQGYLTQLEEACQPILK